jgi:hypothetical protein
MYAPRPDSVGEDRRGSSQAAGWGVVADLDAAIAELRELAGDRPDLLAQHAGLALGVAEASLGFLVPQYQAEAELCLAAGADETQIPAWVELGRKRAAQSRLASYIGGSRSGRFRPMGTLQPG